MNNSSIFNFILLKVSNNIPSWIVYDFVDDKLVYSIEIPSDFIENLNFSFYI